MGQGDGTPTHTLFHVHTPLRRSTEGRVGPFSASTGLRRGLSNGSIPPQDSGLVDSEITQESWGKCSGQSRWWPVADLAQNKVHLPRLMLTPQPITGQAHDPSPAQISGGSGGSPLRIQPLTSYSYPGQDILYLRSGKCGEKRLGGWPSAVT